MSMLVPGLLGALAGNYAPVPPDIGNRVFHWNTDGAGGSFLDEAATVPAADNTRVAAIKGAVGQLFTQSDMTNRPLYRLNRQNGLPSLYFDSTRNDRLKTESLPFLAQIKALSALTFLIVWRPLSGSDQCVWHMARSSNGMRIGPTTSNRVRAYRRGNLSTAGEAEMTSADTFAFASATLFTFSGFGGTMRLDDNFSHTDSDTADTADSSLAWTEGNVGSSVGNHDNFLGELFELLIWDQAADAGQRTAAFAYATSKWGLVT